MAQTTSEEIIEKRDSNPVAVSCIVVTFIVLVGATCLQLVEISEQGADLSDSDRQSVQDGSYIANVVRPAIRKELQSVEDFITTSKTPPDQLARYEEITGRRRQIITVADLDDDGADEPEIDHAGSDGAGSDGAGSDGAGSDGAGSDGAGGGSDADGFDDSAFGDN